MKRIFPLFTLMLVLFLTGCDDPKNQTSTENEKESTSHAKWDYTGESGPDHWAELEANAACDGLHQSPINIIDNESLEGDFISTIKEIEFEDLTTVQSITNNGHTIQYNFDADLNVLEYKNGHYKMEQFHFHSPSEHTINGVRYPLEIHMVHYSEKTDSYIVLAILVEQGEPDSTFTFLQKYLPIKEGETKEVNKSFDFGSTIKEFFGTDSLNLYSYQGSLTTPPCTEKVLWIVVKDASSASAEQLELLQELMPKNNYRDTQPLNDRKVYRETIVD